MFIWERGTRFPAIFPRKAKKMEEYYVPIGLGVFMRDLRLIDSRSDERRIKTILEANDQMWNDIISKHQETIAKAYEEGHPCTFRIKRN